MGPMASPVISSGRLGSLYSGTRSISGSSEITTAEACTEAWRVQPSSALATSHSSVDPGLALDLLGERGGLLERLVERDVEREARDELGDAVGLAVGEAEDARHVAEHRLGAHGPERDDVGDPVRAVAVDDVADDLVAPVVGEIDVHVGHRDALGVEEPLEDQPVADGVDVGDAEAIGGERAGRRAAARPDGDAPGGARRR